MCSGLLLLEVDCHNWNVQHYFVSIRKTFIDIFVALTELQKKKKLLHTLYHKKILFSHEKPHKIFFAPKKQRKILLACGLSIRQLPALGYWNVTLLLLWLLLQEKCEYHRHRTCCDYLVVATCQDCSTWNERKKTPTFLSAGRKYGLRFVKKLCTHVQVLALLRW